MCALKLKFVCLLFLGLSLSVMAQDIKVLTQEVESLFKDVRSSERKLLVEESVTTWTSAFFTEEERDSITLIFKEMQDLRLAPAIDLKNFAGCVNQFRRDNEKENLKVWLEGLKVVLKTKDRRRTVVKNYLDRTSEIICEKVIFAGSSHKWIIRGKCQWMSGEVIRIDFPAVDLICQTLKDSIAVRRTAATYNLNSNILTGKGGCVRWQSQDSMYAELADYRVDMSVSEYSADSVLFYYERWFGGPVLGQLKDNASKYARTKAREYPFFTSYSTDLVIDTLFPFMNFRGGVIYAGERMSGFGFDNDLAYLHISPNDTVHLYVYSKRFSMDSNRIMTGSAKVVLPLDSGQLFHPNVNFSYIDHNRTVTIKRLSEQSLHIPFRDDYHQILFSIEQIVWPIDSSYMEMSMNSRSGLFKAQVESLNFFSDNIYDDMQRLDEIHPLNALHKTALALNTNTFSIQEYAGEVKKSAEQLRKQLIALSYNDFLEYSEQRDEVTLKQRLFDYTAARVGKKDYDNIRFDSHPKDSRLNAVLDLRNFNLKIFGVEKFTISNTKDIYVEPSDKSVVMMKNRDMEFSGKLKAGMFDMFGTNLFFSYDRYTVDLTHVDSTGMYQLDKMTKKRGERVNSLIRDVTGDIVIDKPDNKSGKKANEGFPVFNSTKDSYVYFDDPDIQHGVYKRDSFYFIIRPYTLKNINDGDKFRYAFSGTLVSNIVPDINDTLSLMKDNTLGMHYTTPGKGLELYGEGNIKSDLTLNSQGFQGDGGVEMNRSHFKSKAILMTPDSLLALTPLLVIDSVNRKRPGAKGENIRVKYLKEIGNLQAMSTDKPFNVYKDRIKHCGTLSVYKELMNASGNLELKDAKLSSKLFLLQAKNILSDNTSLQLSSFANKNIQLNTSSVNANIDLALNKGKFMNNEESNKADFPSNRYQCSFKSFTWYMNEAYLNIGIEDEKELQRIWKIENVDRIPDQGRNTFVSTDRYCDSLSFIAPLAKYNLVTGDIECHWVNHIDLANGRFFPDEGNIFVDSQGNIREFKAATFLCERDDRSKTLTDVQLKLKGRYDFNGSGNFDYINQDKKRSVIRFTEIKVDTNRNIYAKVNILPEAHFDLNEGITYKGNIFMYSKEKHMFFNGYTDLTADNTYLKHNWLRVKTYFDAQDVRVPVQVENRNDKDQRIYNGIFLNVDKTVKPYAAFQSDRIFYNDEMIIGGKGAMVWVSKQQKYVIRDTAVGHFYQMSYTPATTTIAACGLLDIAMNIPGIAQHAAGNIRYDLKEEKLELENILYAIDFEVLSKMQAVLLRDFADKKKKNMGVSPTLKTKLYALFGKGAVPMIDKQLERNSNNIPDSLNQLFVFDSLQLSWDTKKRSYIANGKTNLLSIQRKPVEKEMNIMMELIRRRSGNEFYIYLYDDNVWYYFEYTDKALYTLSSNAEYNDILRNEKADKKIVRDKEKLTLYTITLCPDSKKERFLKRMGN